MTFRVRFGRSCCRLRPETAQETQSACQAQLVGNPAYKRTLKLRQGETFGLDSVQKPFHGFLFMVAIATANDGYEPFFTPASTQRKR